jgi:hypothetical protein
MSTDAFFPINPDAFTIRGFNLLVAYLESKKMNATLSREDSETFL